MLLVGGVAMVAVGLAAEEPTDALCKSLTANRQPPTTYTCIIKRQGFCTYTHRLEHENDAMPIAETTQKSVMYIRLIVSENSDDQSG